MHLICKTVFIYLKTKDLNMYSNCIQWNLVYPDPKEPDYHVDAKTSLCISQLLIIKM